MRPILLKGHTRSITYVKYNKDGDLLFTCSKDHVPTVWRADSGERLGTYDGHTGTVWGLDITPDSKLLLTASADQSVRLWDVQTGACLFTWEHKGAVRSVAWAEGDREFATCSDPFGMDVPARINIYPFADTASGQSKEPRCVIVDKDAPRSKVSRVAWLASNATLLAAYDTGALRLYDPATGAKLLQVAAHGALVTSVSFNLSKTLLVTSSTDRTAKLWDTSNLAGGAIKTYVTDTPMNAAVITPGREMVVVGGGQEAMEVTTTAAGAGKFESRFYHMVFQNELGRIRGHFGPINTLAFNPDGRSFASGAEDGFIRLHHLDAEYDTLGVEPELDDPALARALAEGELAVLEEEEAAQQRRAAATAAATAAALGGAPSAAGAASASSAPRAIPAH